MIAEHAQNTANKLGNPTTIVPELPGSALTGTAALQESPEQASTLVELLRWRAQRHPDRRACGFLADGENETARLTYSDLDRQARAIAVALRNCQARGELALLLYPPGLEFVAAFFGCLYSGTVAIPAYPPHPARLSRTLPKLEAIVKDARPILALTTEDLLSKKGEIFEQSPVLQSMQWLATDRLEDSLADEWTDPVVGAETLAFLQYTSGSTASPKGVMVSHGNLLHNSALIHRFFETSETSRGVFWLPFYHDMGLVGGILQTLYCGGTATLMSPLTFLQHPVRWLQAISRTRATISGGPNFAYDLCARKVTAEQRASLDLSSWRLAFNGAEPIRGETLEKFEAAFAPCGFQREAFYPCYGLAEATLMVSGGKKSAPPVVRGFDEEALKEKRAVKVGTGSNNAKSLVGCGKAPPNQEIAIVDPETLKQLPEGRIGEIWVSGPSVAQGYWNRPEETSRTFEAFLGGSGEGPFLRTGDLGFLKGGELFVTGRLKDLIILEGRNHYPQDIELTVERVHPALRPHCSAVFLADVSGKERLIAVAEVEPRYLRRTSKGNGKCNSNGEERPLLDPTEVSRAVRRAVAEDHDIQVYAVSLLRPGRIPKTSSGKIQRHACRAGFLAGTLDQI
jgi:acyl-CoA synthetase (AMP-forming)/AMP-acid ligase II